ncbi:MAG: cation:proton antiporter [Flavobacteriales bacterium]|nr:cation:proton antiporter [Flavobacteriales bacterium]
MSGFLANAVVYLATAVVCVPIAKRLGLGSVLGYLLAGIVIGPYALGFIGEEGKDIMHFAEFGVVMMLFLVGLELEPALFWRMRRQVLGMGGAQVLLTALVLAATSTAMGFTWQAGLAAGLAFAMSSTAIALQSLKEKGLMHTAAGQGSFAVLLFQDIAVIPILALLPLLATAPADLSGEQHWIETLPGWQRTLAVLAAVGTVVALGRYVAVPFLRIVARTRLRELFVASSLLLVVGIALLMETVGLSPALGTFLAGVVLANSEYKHELESDLDPFKGLLLGLFFMAVGASINFDLITRAPGTIIGLTLAVMALKLGILLVVGRRAGFSFDQNLLFSVGLAQVGEFAFVLLAFIAQLALLNNEWTDTLMAITAISMTLTPLFMLLNEKLILPRFGTTERPAREADAIDEKHRVIIAGFGHFGSTLGRLLRANGVRATILDNDSDQVDLLRRMGFQVFYGDATRHELLEAAGAHEAELLICAIAPESALLLTETVHKHFPHLKLMVRARNRFDAYELMDQGVMHIHRETLHSSVAMGVDALKELGFRHYTAHRAGQNFLRYDEQSLKELASKRGDKADYISSIREKIAEQEELLTRDLLHDPSANDHAWDSDGLRHQPKA